MFSSVQFPSVWVSYADVSEHSLFRLHRPVKMEQTECSEMLAYKIQTPGNYPRRKHATSVKSCFPGESNKVMICLGDLHMNVTVKRNTPSCFVLNNHRVRPIQNFLFTSLLRIITAWLKWWCSMVFVVPYSNTRAEPVLKETEKT